MENPHDFTLVLLSSLGSRACSSSFWIQLLCFGLPVQPVVDMDASVFVLLHHISILSQDRHGSVVLFPLKLITVALVLFTFGSRWILPGQSSHPVVLCAPLPTQNKYKQQLQNCQSISVDCIDHNCTESLRCTRWAQMEMTQFPLELLYCTVQSPKLQSVYRVIINPRDCGYVC